MKTPNAVARYTQELLQVDPQSLPKVPYIKPSSLARGCLLYVAFELGQAKAIARCMWVASVRRHRQPPPPATRPGTQLPRAGGLL